MVGCYNGLEPTYGGYNLMYWDCASDNLFNYFSWEGRKPIGNGNMSPTNTDMTRYFNFLDIRACNEYLENESNVDWTTTDRQEQYKAEVRAIRALLYFWKSENYGDFPLITTVIPTPDEAKIPQTDVATVREFIVTELKEAIPYLPNKSETVEGRINKQTAQAALMRYYLYRSDYANALAYAEEIEAGGEVSMPAMSYADAFIVSNAYTSEIIFNHTYLEGTEMDLYLPPFMPNAIGGWSSVVPTMDLAECYEMKDGKTTEEALAAGEYDPANPFVNRDPRLRATILYPGQKYSNYESMPDKCYNSMPQYFKDGTRNNDYLDNADNASKSGLQFKKFLQNLDQFNDVNSATMRVPIFRYAEVLLTIAECNIELNQNLDKAISCINQVRTRAGMPEVDQTKYNNQTSLRELVRRERRVEFAGEGLRRFDLIRWGVFVSTLDKFRIYHCEGDVTDELNEEGDFDVIMTGLKEVDGQVYNVQEHHKLLPIFHEDIKKSGNVLKQNPGY